VLTKQTLYNMKPYSKYKQSGIEWIGEIPEHWEVKRLKYLVQEPLKYGANESANDDNPDNPRYIRITDFGSDGNLKPDTFKSLPENIAKDYILKEGDVLFARSGATVGKTFLFKGYNERACFAGYLIKATVNNKLIDSTFLSYLTKTNFYENWKQSAFQQATIQNIGADKYNNLIIPTPSSYKESLLIANYLDVKTSEIDELIAKKEQLIALYKEERTATINQAVTKGLDPNVPMKDSGIEWLGEIPEHWEVKRLKNTCQLITNKTQVKPDYVLALENIESWTGNILNTVGANEMQGDVNLFIEKDILFNKLRPYLAKVVIAPNVGGCVGELLVLRAYDGINSSFLFHRLISEYIITIVDGSTYGSKMPRASWDKFISNIEFGIPPIIEQGLIADFLDNKNKEFDNLLSKTEQEIELLKEYKKALISEVVLGKIDVREEVNN